MSESRGVLATAGRGGRRARVPLARGCAFTSSPARRRQPSTVTAVSVVAGAVFGPSPRQHRADGATEARDAHNVEHPGAIPGRATRPSRAAGAPGVRPLRSLARDTSRRGRAPAAAPNPETTPKEFENRTTLAQAERQGRCVCEGCLSCRGVPGYPCAWLSLSEPLCRYCRLEVR